MTTLETSKIVATDKKQLYEELNAINSSFPSLNDELAAANRSGDEARITNAHRAMNDAVSKHSRLVEQTNAIELEEQRERRRASDDRANADHYARAAKFSKSNTFLP